MIIKNRITIAVLVAIATFVLCLYIGKSIVGPTVCNDGWASPSLGKRGACSYHGGVNRTPTNLVMLFSLLISSVSGYQIHRLLERQHQSQVIKDRDAFITRQTSKAEACKSSVSQSSQAEKTTKKTVLNDPTIPNCPICRAKMYKKRDDISSIPRYLCRCGAVVCKYNRRTDDLS